MDPILPGPYDTIIQADAQGNIHYHRAGDDKRRRAALAARRAVAAEKNAERFSPEAMEAREAELDKAQRQRLTGAIANAERAVARIKADRVELTSERAEALASAQNLVKMEERNAAYTEAASYERRLSQVPAALDAAMSALAEARETLKRFDATAAARAAAFAADAEKRQANAERALAARAAAERLYAELMAAPVVEPAPTPNRKVK